MQATLRRSSKRPADESDEKENRPPAPPAQRQRVGSDTNGGAQALMTYIIDWHGAQLLLYPHVASTELRRMVMDMPVVPSVGFNPRRAAESGQACLLYKPEVVVFGKVYNQPRNVGFFCDVCTGYKYSQRVMPAQRLTPWMQQLMREINALLQTSFNGLLINHYPDGSSHIGAHSDDETGLDPKQKAVATLSIGAERVFRIKLKGPKTRDNEFFAKTDVRLASGSLAVMRGTFQGLFTHEIPKETKCRAPRWSVTFRCHKPERVDYD